MTLDLEAIKARDTALRPDGEAWSCADCGWCSGCSQLLPCDHHAEGDEVLVLVAEVERLRAVSPSLWFIAQSCSHVNDDPGRPLAWDEHIHEPAKGGGHRYCGPCVAFRALADCRAQQ